MQLLFVLCVALRVEELMTQRSDCFCAVFQGLAALSVAAAGSRLVTVTKVMK